MNHHDSKGILPHVQQIFLDIQKINATSIFFGINNTASVEVVCLMTSITFPVSSKQMSTNHWCEKNPLEPQESSTPTLTFVTSSNKSSLCVNEVRYSFCVPLPSYFRNRLCHIQYTSQPFSSSIHDQSNDTQKQMISND